MGQKKNSTIFSLSLNNSEWKSRYIEKNVEESSSLLHKNIEVLSYLTQIFKLHGLTLHSCAIEYTQKSINFFILFFEKKTETEFFYKKHKRKNLKKKRISLVPASKNTPLYVNSKELIFHVVNNILIKNLSLFFKSKAINIKVQNLNEKFAFLLRKNISYYKTVQRIPRTFKRFTKDRVFKELMKVFFIATFEKDSSKLVAKAISRYFTKHKKRHGLIITFLKKILLDLQSLKFSKIKGVKIIINGRFNGAQRSNRKIIKVGIVPLQSFVSTVSYFEDTAYTKNGTFGVKVWICEKD
jgi:ribosomal protein S3